MADQQAGTRIREQVRTHYAAAAAAVTAGAGTGCCPGAGTSCCATHLAEQPGLGAARYTAAERDQLPPGAVAASLGCGNPVAVAYLHAGETVLDLGSGGGIDVLLSAQGRPGRQGLRAGHDPGDARPRRPQRGRGAGVTNAEFLTGYLEAIPLPAAAVMW
jgi:arsenite methyltransferase